MTSPLDRSAIKELQGYVDTLEKAIDSDLNEGVIWHIAQATLQQALVVRDRFSEAGPRDVESPERASA